MKRFSVYAVSTRLFTDVFLRYVKPKPSSQVLEVGDAACKGAAPACSFSNRERQDLGPKVILLPVHLERKTAVRKVGRLPCPIPGGCSADRGGTAAGSNGAQVTPCRSAQDQNWLLPLGPRFLETAHDEVEAWISSTNGRPAMSTDLSTLSKKDPIPTRECDRLSPARNPRTPPLVRVSPRNPPPADRRSAC